MSTPTGTQIKATVVLPQGTVTIDDSMVVNPRDFIPQGEYNPNNVRPWVIGHEHGPFAIVFASHEQEALDIAVDEGKLDGMKVSDEDLQGMTEAEQEELLTAGNASEYFYQDYLWMQELPTPTFPFIALLVNSQGVVGNPDYILQNVSRS